MLRSMSNHPRTPFTPVARANARCRPLAVITVTLFCLFIFSSTDGNITVQGDDIFFIAHAHPFSTDYFREIVGRGYLTPFYSLVYDLCGQNTQRTHIAFFVVFWLSALLFYAVLSRFLPPPAALVGAFFYLAYVGKHETVTWISAGAYLVAMAVFFASAYLALSAWPGLGTRVSLIVLINWVTLHLCEILIVAAPLWPVLYWMASRMAGKSISKRYLVASFAPLAVFLLHVLVLYHATPKGAQPLWFRGPGAKWNFWHIMDALWSGLKIGLVASVGQTHYSLLGHGVEGFLRYVPFTWWTGVTLGCALLGVAGVFRLCAGRAQYRCSRIVFALGCATGFYLVAISPVVGALQNRLFMPSRLVSLSGVGLALLLALVVYWAWERPRWGRFAVAGVMLLIVLEGMAMNSILYEHQTSWAYDSKIREQLMANGVRLELGDTVFLSLPRHPLRQYWRTGFSQFEGGHAVLLLALDNGLVVGNFAVPVEKRINYKVAIREKGEPVQVPAGLPGRVFAFFVRDGDYRLMKMAMDGTVLGAR